MERPFKVISVKHIAIGAESNKGLEHFFVDLLGIGKLGGEEEILSENVREIKLGLPDGLELDLMEPIDASKKPNVANRPLHHFALQVDNLDAAFRWLQSKGVRMTGEIRKGASGRDIFFVHPKGNSEFPIGSHVLLEFTQ